MKAFILTSVFTVFIVVFSGCTPVDNRGVVKGVIQLEGLDSLYRLAGAWLVHSGDGTETPPDVNSKLWGLWRVPDSQGTLELDATEKHSTWLRLDFTLPRDFKPQALGLLIPSNGNYSIFLNGNKVREYKYYGEIVQTGTSLIRLDAIFLRPGENRIFFMGDRLIGLTGPNPGIFLGREDLVARRYMAHWVWNCVLSGIFLFFGFFHLFLFYKRPSERAYFWLGILLVGSAVYVVCSAYLIFALYYSTWVWLVWWFTLGSMFPALVVFLHRIFNLPMSGAFPKLLLGSFVAWNLFPLMDLLFNDWTLLTFKIGIPMVAPLSLLLNGYLIVLLIKAIRQKQTAALTILIGLLVYLASTVNDQLVNQNLYYMPLLIGEGMLVLMLSLIFAQGLRFTEVHANLDKSFKLIEQQNQDLEKKVELRTDELRKSLDKINSLKVIQDGDYYLTSRILDPLGRNHVVSSRVDVEFLIKQKKEFKFKKWSNEIGGDINIAHNITLEGRKYIVFLNGDAMGKSLQGAGGALVLGAIFHAIVDRVKAFPEEQSRAPRNWLQNTFFELQKVFESFDGSMLVSMVLGLLDEESGLVYYVNAEHPFPIVFSRGAACFIEHEIFVRKLGTPSDELDLIVQKHKLEPGDSLILASDGRDDIHIHNPLKPAERNLNDDSELILRVIEDSKGDLQETLRVLNKKGELTDDISFLKVTYN